MKRSTRHEQDDSVRYLLNTLGPQLLVQVGVDPHISGAHLDLGKLADFLDGARGAFLETYSMEPLVEVDGVLAGDHLIDGRLLFPLLLDHFDLHTRKALVRVELATAATCNLTSQSERCRVQGWPIRHTIKHEVHQWQS